TRRIERPAAIRPRSFDPSPERQAAFRRGLSAETRAALLLRVKGYRILARRWQSPVGEIDLVAWRRRVLVFVEVKARARLDDAAQMDPNERINIRGDSTFALLLEAQARGFPIAYYTPDQLAMRDGTLFARVRPLSVVDRPGEHYSLGEARRVELASFDVVLMR